MTGLVVLVLLLGVALLPFVLLGAGTWLLWEREAGTRTRVHVDPCLVQHTGRSDTETCTGSWTSHGRVVVGPVDGATSSQEGDTIDVTVRGDTAYSRSPKVALILIGLSLPFFIVPVRWVLTSVRRRRATRATG
ncbi:MAG: hypothetical protein WB797_04880 [Nocardioides sp.]